LARFDNCFCVYNNELLRSLENPHPIGDDLPRLPVSIATVLMDEPFIFFDQIRKNLPCSSKSANKLSTSCVHTACFKLQTSIVATSKMKIKAQQMTFRQDITKYKIYWLTFRCIIHNIFRAIKFIYKRVLYIYK
jgi:hypothetical protein